LVFSEYVRGRRMRCQRKPVPAAKNRNPQKTSSSGVSFRNASVVIVWNEMQAV
jgi:hypothetical protein